MKLIYTKEELINIMNTYIIDEDDKKNIRNITNRLVKNGDLIVEKKEEF